MRVDGSVLSQETGLQAGGQLRAVDAALMVFVFAAGLYLDRNLELPVQAAGSVLVWAVMLRFLHRARGDLRIIILGCLAWSSFGEVFGSLIWGLYKYRLYNVPMFVPPGHVLMLLLALYVAERLRGIVLVIAPVVALVYVAYALHAGIDTLSIALAPAFIITLIVARKRNVYAATFLLAIALELYGTWLGNWRWEPTAPWLGVSSANPPVCIGAVYCLRDALAGYTLGWVLRWRQRARSHRIPEQPPRFSAHAA